MPHFPPKHLFLVFYFALAFVFGTSYTIFVNHDASFSSDEQSYLRMAQGDYAVATTHRYRVVVPVLASAMAHLLGGALQLFQPDSARGNLPLGSSFFLVNMVLMAFTGLFIFRACVAYGATRIPAFVAMAAVMTCPYAGYLTGIALTDSLYLLIFALTLYGIKAKSSAALLFCILLGPLAKESFIFLAPVIFLFGHQAIPRGYQLLLFLGSGLITFGIRHLIDQQVGLTAEAGLNNAFHHLQNVGPTFRRMGSGSGLTALWSAFGFFYLLLLVGFFGGKQARNTWLSRLDWAAVCVLVAVLIHIPLSGDIGRMAYFGAPVMAVALSLIFTFHPFFGQFFQAVPSEEEKNW